MFYVNIDIDSIYRHIFLLEIFALMMIENVLCGNLRLLQVSGRFQHRNLVSTRFALSSVFAETGFSSS